MIARTTQPKEDFSTTAAHAGFSDLHDADVAVGRDMAKIDKLRARLVYNELRTLLPADERAAVLMDLIAARVEMSPASPRFQAYKDECLVLGRNKATGYSLLLTPDGPMIERPRGESLLFHVIGGDPDLKELVKVTSGRLYRGGLGSVDWARALGKEEQKLLKDRPESSCAEFRQNVRIFLEDLRRLEYEFEVREIRDSMEEDECITFERHKESLDCLALTAGGFKVKRGDSFVELSEGWLMRANGSIDKIRRTLMK